MVIKTYTALIRNYASLTQEDQEKELIQVTWVFVRVRVEG